MRKGFTMIELIFVIVILGILTTIATPKLSAIKTDADTISKTLNKRVNDINQARIDSGLDKKIIKKKL